MDKSQLQIDQLTQLQDICTEILGMQNTKQNDAELVKLLKKKYTLSKEEIDSVKSIVMGKMKGDGADAGDLETLKKKCESYCVICDINTNGRNGEFIGYDKLKNKCSNKKSILKKAMKGAADGA